MIGRALHLVDADGRRWPVERRLIIGRSRDIDIVIQSGRVSRHHVALLRLPSGEIEAEDLGTTTGTRLNGAPLHNRLLAHGDVIELDDRRYVVELGPELPTPVDAAAELLGKAETDAELQVAIDLLLERGDPVGTLLAQGEPLPLSVELESAISRGLLELEWRRGFIQSAHLRAQPFHFLRELLIELLGSEAARFLRGLALPEFTPRLGLHGAPLPTLKTLCFGPFFTPEAAASCTQALSEVTFQRAPLLHQPEVQEFGSPWLEFDGGQRRELTQGRQETFPSCSVRWEPGGWLVSRVRQNATLLVNGRSHFTRLLIPGDVVSAHPTQFSFRASRVTQNW